MQSTSTSISLASSFRGGRCTPAVDQAAALIDVGSTSVSLWVASRLPDGFCTHHKEKRLLRLGAARDAHGRISDDAIQGFVETLLKFRRSVGDHPARVVATASLRQASNRHEIQDTVRKVVGWDLEILTGRQEALAAYQGTVFATPSSAPQLVVDVGGGSTELIWGDNDQAQRVESLPFGVVRLRHEFGLVGQPSQEQLERAHGWLSPFFRGLRSAPSGEAIACSGTMKRLIGLHCEQFPPPHDQQLSRSELEAVWRQVLGLGISQPKGLPGLDPGRSDLLLAGAFIFREISDALEIDNWSLTAGGVRWGLMDQLLSD